MNLDLRNPLAVFDLETTGTNIIHDRIIEISVIRINVDNSTDSFNSLIHPEMPIPDETSKIHGIYDKAVKDAPTFKDLAKDLIRFLKGCDLAGFNVIKFDLPILVEEFLRLNINFDISKRRVIDVQKIFHLMEKRTLAAAYRFYCGKSLDNAHSAEADTLATREILLAQIERYNNQPVTDILGRQIGTINNDIQSLHDLTSHRMIDLAGRFRYDDNGDEIINFGKHKGKRLREVLKDEPSYYDWMMKGEFPQDTKRKLTEIKLKEFGNQ